MNKERLKDALENLKQYGKVSNKNEITSFPRYSSLSKEAKDELHKYLDDMFHNDEQSMN